MHTASVNVRYEQRIRLKKWSAFFTLIALYTSQLLLSGTLKISAARNLIGYKISFSRGLNLTPLEFILIFIISLILLYVALYAFLWFYYEELYQIFGKKSIYDRYLTYLEKSGVENDFSKEQIDEYCTSENLATEPLAKYLFIATTIDMYSKKAGIKSIRRAYIGKINIPNALTFRTLPIPFIGKDWIVINKNLIDILSDNEVEAIIAHELGHIKKFDSWFAVLFYYPRLLMTFSWFYIRIVLISLFFTAPFTLLLFFARVGFWIAFELLLYQVNWVAAKINTIYQQSTELLADHYASETLVDAEKLTNALIKLGQRGEVIRAIQQEIEWLESRKQRRNIEEMVLDAIHYIDPAEMSVKKGKELAIQYYVSNELNKHPGEAVTGKEGGKCGGTGEPLHISTETSKWEKTGQEDRGNRSFDEGDQGVHRGLEKVRF